ncbi:hypothetical protein [Nautilia sp.]
MKQLIISLFLFSLLFSTGFDAFSEFEKFEKNDKKEFQSLKKKAESCINNWDFSCTSDALDKMKLYITSPKDKKIISSLWDKYYDEKEAKRRYEEKQRARSRYVSVSIRDCYNKTCSVNVNGSYAGTIAYWWKSSSGGYYVINYKATNGGLLGKSGHYHPSLNEVYMSDCGTKRRVYSLKQAMKYVVKCAVSGHY